MTLNRPVIPPTEPWVPRGEDALPALRYVIYSDLSHQLRRIDESAGTVAGYWESPCLIRAELSQVAAVWGVTALLLYYTARDDVGIDIEWTGDGGRKWTEKSQWVLSASRGGIKSNLKGFNITGFDLRFRLHFREAQPISIHAYRPRMIPRGILIGAGR